MNERIHEKVFLFIAKNDNGFTCSLVTFFQLMDYTMAGVEDILGHTGNLKIRDK